MTTAAEVLLGAARTMRPVDLDTVNATASMLTRVDRKYVVTTAELDALLSELAGETRVLEIDGLRVFGYESTYFDTADLATYRAHLQRRRRRYKVRRRRYLDSGLCFTEVKWKGYRQSTVKERQPHEPPAGRRVAPVLLPSEHDFVSAVIASAYHAGRAPLMEAVLEVRNRRATLLSERDSCRLTVDVDVSCHDSGPGWGRSGRMRDGVALVEVKSEGGTTRADELLRSMNVRASTISKYCTSVALLRPDVSSNPWHRLVRDHFVSSSPGCDSAQSADESVTGLESLVG